VVKAAFSCVMMSLLISNSLHVSVRPNNLVNDISVIPNFLHTIFEYSQTLNRLIIT
jgi:hypothetical protein